jgi:hypothetical protein
MARRKSSAGSGLGMAVLLALAALAVAGPFLIAGWSLFNEMRARRYRGTARVADLVSGDERHAIEAREQRIDGLEAGIRRVEAEGDRQGLARRADGAFDARSAKGRDLNRQIEGLRREQADLLGDLAQIRGPVERRIEAWLRARSGLVGARAGLLAFVGVFIAMTASRAQSAGETLGPALLLFGNGADGADRVLASAAATLAAAFTLWIASAATRSSLAA